MLQTIYCKLTGRDLVGPENPEPEMVPGQCKSFSKQKICAPDKKEGGDGNKSFLEFRKLAQNITKTLMQQWYEGNKVNRFAFSNVYLLCNILMFCFKITPKPFNSIVYIIYYSNVYLLCNVLF